MKKKYLIFGMAVILGASLSFFGCESATDGAAGAAGAPGEPGLGFVSGPVTADGLQAVIDGAVAAGATVYLDNITLSTAGPVDFKTVKARIIGDFKTATSGITVINAIEAAVEFAAGAKIAGDGVIVGASEVFTGTTAPNATVVAPADGLPTTAEEVTALGGVTAVKDLELTSELTIPAGLKVAVYGTLTINGTADEPSGGYGDGIAAIGTVLVTKDNTAALADADKVYVAPATIQYDGNTAVTVTLPADLEVFAFKVTSEQGVLKVNGGTASVEAAVTANNGFVEFASAVTRATITGKGRIRFANSTTPTAFVDGDISGDIIEFPNGFVTQSSDWNAVTLSAEKVNIPKNKTIAFGKANANVSLAKGTAVWNTESAPVKVFEAPENGGYQLSLTGTTDTVLTIGPTAALPVTGDEITFSGDVAFGGGLSVEDGDATFNSDAEFGGDVTFDEDSTFNGNAVFKGDLTLTGATEFGKDAFFADGKKITLKAAGSTITLKTGSELAQASGPSLMPTVYSAIIANFDDNDVTLTPGANTVLTFGASGTKSITQSGTAAHSIKIGGEATLVPGATYTVASETGKVGTLTMDGSAKLFVGAGLLTPRPEGFGTGADNDDATSSKLVLTGAATTAGASLTGAGSVVAGKTTIVGGTNGWQAVAASGTPTVTIEKDSIAASAALELTAGATGATEPSITVSAGGTLKIGANTSVKVATNATITLAKHATDGGTLNLSATTAKITGLKGGSNNRNLTTSNIANATYAVGADTGKITGGGDSGDGKAWIGGGNTGPNPIKPSGADDDVAIDKTTTVGSD
jgi:hypothetical protein